MRAGVRDGRRRSKDDSRAVGAGSEERPDEELREARAEGLQRLGTPLAGPVAALYDCDVGCCGDVGEGFEGFEGALSMSHLPSMTVTVAVVEMLGKVW
ncbi:unnamed protein product [Closterium sp. NIES-54]